MWISEAFTGRKLRAGLYSVTWALAEHGALWDHLLVEDEVRGEVEHLGVGVFVGSPAERERGKAHPWVLDERDLVLDGQRTETCGEKKSVTRTRDNRTCPCTCSRAQIKPRLGVCLIPFEPGRSCVLQSTPVIHKQAGQQSCVHTGRRSRAVFSGTVAGCLHHANICLDAIKRLRSITRISVTPSAKGFGLLPCCLLRSWRTLYPLYPL